MESAKRQTENEKQAFNESFAAHRSLLSAHSTCPACGARAQRESAQFCLICGKLLREDYEPLDRLRASYSLQGKSFDFDEEKKDKKEEITNLFEQNKNSVSQTAWACLVYSFVPYLGILFVPFTFLIGGFGVIVAWRQPQLGGRKLALVSFFLSFVVLAMQIFLWWLLYIIPEIGRRV